MADVYIEKYFCKNCGKRIGTGPVADIGSPFVTCKCGTETILENYNEWDYMQPRTRADQIFGVVISGLGAGAIPGFAGYMIIGGLLLGKKDEELFANWPLIVLIVVVLSAIFIFVFASDMRRKIRKSRERLANPEYRQRLETWLESRTETQRRYR